MMEDTFVPCHVATGHSTETEPAINHISQLCFLGKPLFWVLPGSVALASRPSLSPARVGSDTKSNPSTAPSKPESSMAIVMASMAVADDVFLNGGGGAMWMP